ncbi:hypothetical protein BX600DRAFT_439488 [Xylariales sp. PMI_506]|nr:hypothetical protein BX600DRAFT_439488 [Xylariales sp. PMI_506]
MRFSAVWTLPLLVPASTALPTLSSLLDPLAAVIKTAYRPDGFAIGTLGQLGGIPGVDATYDYVVVGGGTAGNVIGYRLAKAGFSVAIVEAGTFYEIAKPILATSPGGVITGSGSLLTDSRQTVDWRLATEPQVNAGNREIHYARGKTLGGSSELNFLVYHRPTSGTFDVWADEVDDESYRFENMLPYYERSVTFTPPNTTLRGENVTTEYDADVFSATGGPVQVSYANFVPTWATLIARGLDALGLNATGAFSSGSLLGYHYTQTTIRASTQARSSSSDFVKAARCENLGTLKVYTQSLGRQVLFNDSKKATGVRVSTLGLDYTLTAAKEVIVSAGVFQSPQLLMVSGVGPAETLEQFNISVVSDLPGVGQNLWDHILFGPAFEVSGLEDTLSGAINDPIVLQAALTAYAEAQAGPLTSNQVELLGWEKLPQSYRANFSEETVTALNQFPADWPEVEFIPLNGYSTDWRFPLLQQPTDGKKYASLMGALVAPLSRGNVTIRSNSTTDLPVVDPNFLGDKGDQEVAIAMYRRLRELAGTDVLSGVISSEAYPGADKQSDEDILAALREGLMTVWHAACTCKMGKASDALAVLDSEARVYGVEGLRVVDASAFPVLPPGHPQATVYGLAEKISDDIINSK